MGKGGQRLQTGRTDSRIATVERPRPVPSKEIQRIQPVETFQIGEPHIAQREPRKSQRTFFRPVWTTGVMLGLDRTDWDTIFLRYGRLVREAEFKKMADAAVLTIREVAELLKVDAKTVYRLVRGRQLPGFKVAGTWRFKNTDIDQWIERQKEAVGGPDSDRRRKRRRP